MKQENCRSLFTLAGLEILNMWELPNGYWPNPGFSEKRLSGDLRENHLKNSILYARLREESPWWLVKTKFGLIEIGWRKRVIQIDWKDTGLEVPDLTHDDITKGRFYVHAWTEMKAVEYLQSLREKLESQVGVLR